MCGGGIGFCGGKCGDSGLPVVGGRGFVCLGDFAVGCIEAQQGGSMSNTVFLMALACMSAITFVLRAAPTLLPRKLLESRWLGALNFALPLSVMVVLILAALPLKTALLTQQWSMLLAQVLALLLVLLVYIKWRNVLVAMVTGVAALNAILWLF